MGFAVASGLLLVFSFPKFGHPVLAWIALVPLFVALTGWNGRPDRVPGVRPLRALHLGLVTGVIYFVGTLYWTGQVIQTFGGIPTPVAMVGVVLLGQGTQGVIGGSQLRVVHSGQFGRRPRVEHGAQRRAGRVRLRVERRQPSRRIHKRLTDRVDLLFRTAAEQLADTGADRAADRAAHRAEHGGADRGAGQSGAARQQQRPPPRP